jgi:hypothetical protein
MKTLITVSFAIMLLVMMALSASAALDPEMILYFAFDEQLDGKKVADLTGGGNDGKLKLGAKITNEPAEVYKGAGALKIFNNISAQFLVESFKEMDNYRENTYTFWLYIYGVRDDPCCPEEIVLQKANILVGDAKGNSPAIFVTDPGLGLTYKFGDQGAVGLGVGPGGEGEKFELNKWYHIAGVKKGADLIIYIDGEEANRYNVKRDFVQGKGHLRIGGSRIRAASFAMDEFGLYTRALTEKEVEADSKGQFLSVEPETKLTTTWGHLKTGR